MRMAGIPLLPKVCKVFEGETLGLDLRLADSVRREDRPCRGGDLSSWPGTTATSMADKIRYRSFEDLE
jgi:hypothetical protein